MSTLFKLREAENLRKKGVRYIIEVDAEELYLDGVKHVKEYLRDIFKKFREKYGIKEEGNIEFLGNEDIGARYIIYRFRIYIGKGYIGCRVVTYFNKHLLTILTVGEGIL